MYRNSPIRNPRSKGIKIKHVLQICLLVAVCFWLIFQVKRSHDKKKEFDASDTKISLNSRTEEEVVKFGRKDLQPKLEGAKKEIEKHEEEEEQEEERQENKNEVEEQEEDKIEDGGGGGDDEIDENEIEKSEVEVDREEVDEEIDEKENEEKDGQSQTENGVSADENDQDGATRNTREAREEHYKADDASSAVTHDSPTVRIENGNLTLDTETAENGPLSNATLMVLESTGDQNTTNGVLSSRTIEETEKTLDSSKVSEAESDEGEGENREEGLDSYETKNPDEVDHEAIDSSDIETEGGNSEDTGAE